MGGNPDASAFLAQHGQFFPGATSLDDVIAQLADRMAAMQSLLRSMTPGQRAELQDMMDALLRDDRLRWDLAEPDVAGCYVFRRDPLAGGWRQVSDLIPASTANTFVDSGRTVAAPRRSVACAPGRSRRRPW